MNMAMPRRHAVAGEVADLHLDIGPTCKHDREIRSERQRQSPKEPVAEREDERSPSVVHQIPGEKNRTRPERVAVNEHRSAE
jgi:hypothetical protein